MFIFTLLQHFLFHHRFFRNCNICCITLTVQRMISRCSSPLPIDTLLYYFILVVTQYLYYVVLTNRVIHACLGLLFFLFESGTLFAEIMVKVLIMLFNWTLASHWIIVSANIVILLIVVSTLILNLIDNR